MSSAAGVTLSVFFISLPVICLIVIPVLAWVVQVRRTHIQAVEVRDGVLTIVDGVSRRGTTFPIDQIGTVVVMPPRQYSGYMAPHGIWTWGGLFVLDRGGKVVRHMASIPGGRLSVYRAAENIPAAAHVSFDAPVHRRSAFLRQYPNSLRFAQLWGPTRWALTILVALFTLPPIVALVVVVIVAALKTAV